MSNKEIDDLTAANALDGTEQLHVLQGGNSRKTDVDAINSHGQNAGVLTASTPYAITQTWNNVAVAFTGAKISITDNASSSQSKLIDIQRNTTSIWWIRNDGTMFVYIASASDDSYGFVPSNGGFGYAGVYLGAALKFGWSSDATWYGTHDVALSRVAAGVLGITGTLKPQASTTALAAMNLPTGAAPSAPNDGDVWREDNTNTGMKIRINGVTKTITVT